MNSVLVKMNSKKRIALVAHDNKKEELLQWAKYNSGTLKSHELFATGTTGLLNDDLIGSRLEVFGDFALL